MKSKWNDVRVASADVTDVYLYDEIGADHITANDFVQVFDAITTPTINVRINSIGGDIYEGYAIYNAIKRKSAVATVITCVDGIAASIASIIALAGSKVRIANDAWMMIHGPRGAKFGTSGDLRKEADELDKLNSQFVAIYAEKTKKSSEEITAMLAAETWFDADEAIAVGLADEIANVQTDAAESPIVASAEKSYMRFGRLPAKLRIIAAGVIHRAAEAERIRQHNNDHLEQLRNTNAIAEFERAKRKLEIDEQATLV